MYEYDFAGHKKGATDGKWQRHAANGAFAAAAIPQSIKAFSTALFHGLFMALNGSSCSSNSQRERERKSRPTTKKPTE